MATVSRLSNSVLRQAYAAKQKGVRLGDNYTKELVDDIFACALKKQTGVSLKYMYVGIIFIVWYLSVRLCGCPWGCRVGL